MIKISRKKYEIGIKTTEILILILFASSAILMGLSQDKLMKSNEISLTNIQLLEASLLGHQIAIQSSINHLIYCNALDLTKYLNESPTLKAIKDIEEIGEACFSTSLKIAVNSSEFSEELISNSVQYRNITNDSFNEYKKESEYLSDSAFWLFILGVFLSLVLLLDMNIFEPSSNQPNCPIWRNS